MRAGTVQLSFFFFVLPYYIHNHIRYSHDNNEDKCFFLPSNLRNGVFVERPALNRVYCYTNTRLPGSLSLSGNDHQHKLAKISASCL